MVAYIFPNFQPCLDPQGCPNRALEQRNQMSQALQQGGLLLRQIRGYTPLSITAEDETAEQIAQSGFSFREIVSVVKSSESLLVEWNEEVKGLSDLQSVYTSTVFILARLDPFQRPVHVLCGYQSRPWRGRNWEIPILGAYDPSAESYRGKWTCDYTERICICEPDLVKKAKEREISAYASASLMGTPYARSRRADKDRQRYTTKWDAR